MRFGEAAVSRRTCGRHTASQGEGCASHTEGPIHNSIPIIHRPGVLGDDVFYGVEHRVCRGALPADPSLTPPELRARV